jgi:hypothetical protein
MKIIISHDVDHIAFREHWGRDLFIPKWLVKNLFYTAAGELDLSLGIRRWVAVFEPRMHRVEEVMDWDHRFGIPSTFFVGVVRGLGLSYALNTAAQMVRLVQDNGFAVGVHGLAYAHPGAIQAEHDRFQMIVAHGRSFGVRNHYLRFRPETPTWQAQAGYLFDSSEYGLKMPYVVNGLVEFPVCLMDSYLLNLRRNVHDDAKGRTLDALERGKRLGLPYFTIIFHDCYLSDLFPDHREWYSWLIGYLQDHYEVTDFTRAVHEWKSSCVSDAQRLAGDCLATPRALWKEDSLLGAESRGRGTSS